MCLPSFYPSFLFLLRIPVDLVHEWIKLRIASKVDGEADLLTMKTVFCYDNIERFQLYLWEYSDNYLQLIEDAHECLQAAVDVKQCYQTVVQSTTKDEAFLETLLFHNLSDFEDDLCRMFQVAKFYLNTCSE